MKAVTGPTRILSIVGGLAAALVIGACTGQYKSDFSVVVVNRTVNTIQVLANGNTLGQVTTGQTATFTVQLPETNANEFTNGVAPTPQAEVIFTAKDLKTGITSTAKSATLSQNTPTYVTFALADFPTAVQTRADFTFSPATPGPNQDVLFNASASTPRDATMAWSFGDGGTGTGTIVSHQYAREGTYNVLLVVTSDTGQTSSASRTVTVTSTLPPNAASFTFSPTVPAVNQDVFFNASTSNVGGGATYIWDFGDGVMGFGITITHRFARSGTYNVNLRATNSVGQSAASSRTVSVSATSSQVFANFTFSPINPGINQDVFFNATASIPANATFSWNFGDGSTGSGVTTTHRFAQAGVYSVALTVTNDLGQSSTTARTVPVSPTTFGVTASFTFSPTAPGVTQEVFFNASASTPSNGTFAWIFGDGTNGTGITTTHRFTQPGAYSVSLTVSNAAGQSATTLRTVTVSTTSSQLVANFSFSPSSPTANQVVFFNGTASTSAPGTTITSHVWDFGDGTSGTGSTTTHSFANSGTFVVRLTVTDSAGQTGTTTQPVTVTAVANPTANFSFSPTMPSTSQTVFFNGSGSTGAAGTTIASYAWDFGDGTTGTTVSTTHAFASPGTFVVRLTVTDSGGRTGTTTQSVPVTATVITADFTFSPTNPSIAGARNTVNFDATPSSAGVTSWTWDFGDGSATSTSTVQKPSHTYLQAGGWVVRLTVADSAGRTGTTNKTVTVTTAAPP